MGFFLGDSYNACNYFHSFTLANHPQTYTIRLSYNKFGLSMVLKLYSQIPMQYHSADYTGFSKKNWLTPAYCLLLMIYQEGTPRKINPASLLSRMAWPQCWATWHNLEVQPRFWDPPWSKKTWWSLGTPLQWPHWHPHQKALSRTSQSEFWYILRYNYSEVSELTGDVMCHFNPIYVCFERLLAGLCPGQHSRIIWEAWFCHGVVSSVWTIDTDRAAKNADPPSKVGLDSS